MATDTIFGAMLTKQQQECDIQLTILDTTTEKTVRLQI
jgi:hypothetical protein